MNTKTLVKSLKLALGVEKNRQLANVLGYNATRITQFIGQPEQVTGETVGSLVLKVQEQAKKSALRNAIKPIVEYCPIDDFATPGEQWRVFETGDGAYKYHQGLRAELEQAIGLYIFYDAQGQALYVGKTKKANLWERMHHSFNNKEVSAIKLTNHPELYDKTFVPAYRKRRPMKTKHFMLHEMAHYFAAYKVEEELIDVAEGLLIAALFNNLGNSRLESLSGER